MKRGITRYLLRLDDYCPTLRKERWNPLLALLDELDIHPILAVIPQNEDEGLKRTPADPAFWEQVRRREAAGTVIGMHGYRHLSCSRGRSLVALHRDTEFAGASYEVQVEWIQTGLEILNREGLHPRLWIAPRHGLDRNTLRALRQSGLEMVSDGFARAPFWRSGVLWLPQQLWAPLECGPGLWTICIHPDTATEEELEALCRFLREHREEFATVEQALDVFPAQDYNLKDAFYGAMKSFRIRLSRFRKRLFAYSNCEQRKR